MADGACDLLLTGDVMLGRGVDQALPEPVDPTLVEPFVESAREYVELARRATGLDSLSRTPSAVWGDALEALRNPDVDARIVNLETAITRRGSPAPGKGIHYRVSPENAQALQAAAIDACVLANNHVLDWGREGLADTLATLERMGIAGAGAGRSHHEAWSPAELPLPRGGRLLLFGCCLPTSGVPEAWSAGWDRPGVAYIGRAGRAEARSLARWVEEHRRPGDRVVVSIHWGPNWGYGVSAAERRFARTLVESGAVDGVHGHSSHHPRPPVLHRGRPLFFGCGDFLNDYEGIPGHESYRPELVLLHRVRFPRAEGQAATVTLVPFRVRGFRLERAGDEDARWLAETLTREGRGLGTRLDAEPGGTIRLREAVTSGRGFRRE